MASDPKETEASATHGSPDWDDAQKLYELGIGVPELQREEVLSGVSPSVAALVRLLWDRQSDASQFLARPLVDLTPAVGAFALGQTIGERFNVLERIGSGGMGEVYKARDTVLGRMVAIKVIRKDIVNQADFRTRLEREARSVCNLNHPHICALYDLCWEGDLPFLVMELLSGKTLADRIAEGRLKLPELLDVADAIADALAFAHEQGVVHRDLKPANVMLTDVGVKLLDFGIAKQMTVAISDKSTVTVLPSEIGQIKTGQHLVVGSVAYMSPEQAEGKSVDQRSDIFSFGAVLYEMATGTRAFQGDSAVSILAAVVGREPPLVRSTGAAIPRQLERIVKKCLMKQPARRYGACAAVRADLRKLRSRFAGRWKVTAVTAALAVLTVAALWRTNILTRNYARLPAAKSVVVLPFGNQSNDPRMEYLADGLSGSLTNSLSRIRNLKVVAESTAFTYKNRATDLRRIGRELNVATIVTGRLAANLDRIRVQSELIEAATGSQLWGQQYDGTVDDALKIQDAISRQLMTRLETNAAPTPAAGQHHTTQNSEAYQLYLKGRYSLNHFSVMGMQKATGYFENALEVDPGYALAFTGLAEIYTNLAGSALSPREAFTKARAAAQKAVQLDPESPEAHMVLGSSELWHDFSWREAEHEFRQAIALNPNNAAARVWLAWDLAATRRFDEAVTEAARGHDIDPLSAFVETGLGQILYYAGRPEEAAARLRNVVATNPDFYFGHLGLGVAYLHLRRYNDAVRELREAAHLDAAPAYPIGYLGFAYQKLGDRRQSEEMRLELERRARDGYVPKYLFALISVARQDYNEAIRWLQRGLDDPEDMLFMSRVDSLFDPIRDHADFKAFCETGPFAKR